MSWSATHLHRFRIHGKAYGIARLGGFSFPDNPFRVQLCDFRLHRGEQVFLELIRDYPDNAAGYAYLADLLGYGPTPGSEAIDRQRAQLVLEEALARPVTDAADYDLEFRLSDLRNTSPAEDEEIQA